MAPKTVMPPVAGESPFDDYDEFELRVIFRIQAGQVVMQFSGEIQRVRMTSGGARKLAALLTEKAAELDRAGDSSSTKVKPPKRSSRHAPAKRAE